MVGAQAEAQAEALVVVATDQAQAEAEAMVAVKVPRLAKKPGTVTRRATLNRRCFMQEWVTRMGKVLHTDVTCARHKVVKSVAATAT